MSSQGIAPPTLSGYTTWLESNGFNTTVLPSNSLYIGYSFNVALQIVNQQINTVSPTMYTLAVYNLAASQLLSWCPDQSGQTFFSSLRAKWNLDDPISGVVGSSGDNGTNESLIVPKQMENLTIANMQNFKDPYGRAYLGIAQSVGTLWGLT